MSSDIQLIYTKKQTKNFVCFYIYNILSAQNYLNGMLACAHIGDYGAVNCLAVNGQALNALADVGGVLDGDVVNSASELS